MQIRIDAFRPDFPWRKYFSAFSVKIFLDGGVIGHYNKDRRKLSYNQREKEMI